MPGAPDADALPARAARAVLVVPDTETGWPVVSDHQGSDRSRQRTGKRCVSAADTPMGYVHAGVAHFLLRFHHTWQRKDVICLKPLQQ